MNDPTAALPSPDDVLAFWFGDGPLRDWPADDISARWFGGGAELDAQMRERFGALVDVAQGGGLLGWKRPLRSRLALIIVLDQFSRNVHRGSALAFAGDGRAQKLVLQSLAIEQDRQLPVAARLFFYLPLMHAESLALQYESVARLESLVRACTPELAARLQGSLRSARQHLSIIEKFGRFPHRNAALGRSSTPAEEAFLQDGPRFGQ